MVGFAGFLGTRLKRRQVGVDQAHDLGRAQPVVLEDEFRPANEQLPFRPQKQIGEAKGRPPVDFHIRCLIVGPVLEGDEPFAVVLDSRESLGHRGLDRLRHQNFQHIEAARRAVDFLVGSHDFL